MSVIQDRKQIDIKGRVAKFYFKGCKKSVDEIRIAAEMDRGRIAAEMYQEPVKRL